jgi:hypothetical protein
MTLWRLITSAIKPNQKIGTIKQCEPHGLQTGGGGNFGRARQEGDATTTLSMGGGAWCWWTGDVGGGSIHPSFSAEHISSNDAPLPLRQ